ERAGDSARRVGEPVGAVEARIENVGVVLERLGLAFHEPGASRPQRLVPAGGEAARVAERELVAPLRAPRVHPRARVLRGDQEARVGLEVGEGATAEAQVIRAPRLLVHVGGYDLAAIVD